LAILIRFILLISILAIAFFLLKYIFNSKRKLELAHQKKELFLLDDFNNVRKNLLVTQKGVLFEGEKYMGTADEAFRVVHIKIWPHKAAMLHGLTTKDFIEVEKKLFERYPYAAIEWSNIVKELLRKEEKSKE
jgi:hypothetical protein